VLSDFPTEAPISASEAAMYYGYDEDTLAVYVIQILYFY
jgi:hypothetical protein